MAATRVPPEVWLQIIRDASYVPSYDMSQYDPLPPNGPCHLLSGKLIVLIREALSTKCAISLVCRLWSTIVVEFLYDFIVVRDAVHIPLIVDQLSRTATHIPLRVQRIDFICLATTRDIYYKGESYNAKQLAWAAAKLIRLCPRLRALSSPTSLWEKGNAMVSKSYSHFLKVALKTVKDTLECLEWRSQWSFESAKSLSHLILPHLKILLSSPDNYYSHASPIEDSHWDDSLIDNAEDCDDEDYPEFPKDRPTGVKWTNSPLHTLSEEYYWNWTSRNEPMAERLSCLRHFIIASSAFWFQLQHQWSALPQINAVTFQEGCFRFVMNEGCILPSTIHTIIFHAQDLPITGSSFHHIKRVGLVGTEALAADEYDYALNLFAGESGSGDDHFPILDMIRFVDTSLSGILKKREFQFKLWERRCRSKGIRLEDETGHLITLARL